MKYFYIGMALSMLLAFGITYAIKTYGFVPLLVIPLMIIAQAHFIIAYLYYIDIVRIRVPNTKKLLIFLGTFIALVVLFYFTRYVWLLALVPLISFLSTLFFIVHHTENIFYFVESFKNDFVLKSRSYSTCGFIALSVTSVVSFITFAYFVKNDPHLILSVSGPIFLISFLLHLVLTVYLMRALQSQGKYVLLLIPLIFSGPFFLKNIDFEFLRLFVISWHVFMWMMLYPIILSLKKKENTPKALIALPKTTFSNFFRKTRSNVWNFIMFYIVLHAVLVFFFMLTAKTLHISPISHEMVFNNIFWGINFFDLWAFAHITFSFFPKKI